jgi:hypothetical protein
MRQRQILVQNGAIGAHLAVNRRPFAVQTDFRPSR